MSWPAATPERRSAQIGFDPNEDVWKIPSEKGAIRIQFKPIRNHWGDLLTERVKDAARPYLEDRSAHTVENAVTFLGLTRIMREGAVEGKTQEPPCGTNVVHTTF